MSAEDSAQPELTPARELRIEKICELMRACKWKTGETGRKLAEELGLAYQTIRLDAAIASRRVYGEVMADRESIGAKVGSALDKALQGAIDAADWKAVAQLSKVYADASGVSAPQRFEASVGAANPTEAAKLVREAFGAQAAPKSDGAPEVP